MNCAYESRTVWVPTCACWSSQTHGSASRTMCIGASIHVHATQSVYKHSWHTSWGISRLCFPCIYIYISYGVATISRLLKIIGLFCRISSHLEGSFAKETYSFNEPTIRIHPIPWMCANVYGGLYPRVYATQSVCMRVPADQHKHLHVHHELCAYEPRTMCTVHLLLLIQTNT